MLNQKVLQGQFVTPIDDRCASASKCYPIEN